MLVSFSLEFFKKRIEIYLFIYFLLNRLSNVFNGTEFPSKDSRKFFVEEFFYHFKN